MHNFHTIAYKLQKAGGLLVLEDHLVLERTLENWLENTHSYDVMGMKARAVFENNQGALDRLLGNVAAQLIPNR